MSVSMTEILCIVLVQFFYQRFHSLLKYHSVLLFPYGRLGFSCDNNSGKATKGWCSIRVCYVQNIEVGEIQRVRDGFKGSRATGVTYVLWLY